jgi:hypothetical protein
MKRGDFARERFGAFDLSCLFARQEGSRVGLPLLEVELYADAFVEKKSPPPWGRE